MWPFNNHKTQKVISLILVLIGIIFLTSVPNIHIFTLNVSGIVIGSIIGFAGLIYFVDAD